MKDRLDKLILILGIASVSVSISLLNHELWMGFFVFGLGIFIFTPFTKSK